MGNQMELSFPMSISTSPSVLSRRCIVDDMPPAFERPKVAEFFAGIGLVRLALERVGFEVVWANDIEPIKQRIYLSNFGSADFHLGDVREVFGADIPNVDVATASFPCTDLSLAGWRRGLAGAGSGMFWEFARIIEEMGERRPAVVLLENVPAFATSRGGEDLRVAVERLNSLGYWCDLLQIDARRFVPQSRPRMFVVGVQSRVADRPVHVDSVRPRHLVDFSSRHSSLLIQATPLPGIPHGEHCLSSVVERFKSADAIWWGADRTEKFVHSLVPLQAERLQKLKSGSSTVWRTAYRRTRNGVALWEVRADAIAGCLRTARGGSSKQAVVEAGHGEVRVRWMTAREYARLQGVPDSFNFDAVSSNQAMFGFGDAVCVPVVEWVARHVLLSMLANPVAVAS